MHAPARRPLNLLAYSASHTGFKLSNLHSRFACCSRLRRLIRLVGVGCSGDELRKEGEKLKKRQARQERYVLVHTQLPVEFVQQRELLVRGSVLEVRARSGVAVLPAGRRGGVRQPQAQQQWQNRGVASLGNRRRNPYERRQSLPL